MTRLCGDKGLGDVLAEAAFGAEEDDVEGHEVVALGSGEPDEVVEMGVEEGEVAVRLVEGAGGVGGGVETLRGESAVDEGLLLSAEVILLGLGG